jgi:predicted ATPase
MIRSLEIEGFKSFTYVPIKLNNLTILSGLNSSGKSSVIQSILLLERASKRESIFLEGHGNILECKNTYCDAIRITGHFEDSSTLEIENSERISDGDVNFPNVIHISADRFGPETYIPISSISLQLGRKGENILKCIEHYSDFPLPEIVKHEKSQGDTLLFNLSAWLGVISPGVKFEPHVQEMSDTSYTTFNGHRAKNVGFGLSYSLPVITALLLGCITPNSLVIIENPEAHLHPRGQTEMSRLIGLCVEAGANILIETHSDHLFDGIRIFAKQNELDFYKKVKAYWFELDENNNTHIEEIEIDRNGRVSNWPKGMFDQFEINASKLL